MTYNPEKHHRRSIRLKGYDYSQAGAYFVTVCTHKRECLFGKIVDGEMQLNDAGRMAGKWWCELKNKFTNIELDEYVIMPNHFHGIIIIITVGVDLCVSPMGEHVGLGGHIGPPLPEIVRWFKTMTTNEYIRGVKQNIYAPVNRRLWQRNYYEHVIRNEDKLNRIREYIINNPLQWQFDRENPDRIKDKAYDNQWDCLEGMIYGKNE
ncbi:MAG TPA: transposase [Candidatus Hypogeohydataceae bacterium YC40]